MNCSVCKHDNRTGAKFCEECAAPLKFVCASCDAELRPTAKFCDECGTATAVSGARGEPQARGAGRARPSEAAGARKIVTIVFADLAGSTALHERLDPESVRVFMDGYYAAMRGAVEAHGGSVTQLLGDGVMAVFGAPLVAEDDAIRAVRAAVAMQQAFRELAERHSRLVGHTGLRVAVNTGEVVASEGSEIIGDPVNVAARLQQEARDGDVVIGEGTRRLVSALVTLDLLGSFALKGRTEAVNAYRVVSLERPAGTAAAAFVGRDDELARIARVYDAARAAPGARLAVLLGSPGLGKSRLIDEFTRRLGDAATVVTAHCEAAGGATFAPLADALRELLDVHVLADAAASYSDVADGIDGASGAASRAAIEAALPVDEAERARIGGGIAALLAGSPAPPEETFFVVRRLLAALASAKPVVLVIDDLHWAAPLLLDLVEHLVQWGGGVPLLVLVGARPELRDTRSSLATPGGLVAEVITLAGLDAGAATRLAASVIGAADLPTAVAAKVLAASEGNPLFVGELVRMLVHEGALKRDGDRWSIGAGLADLEMPPTIHALLAARIERLRPEERAVLERAAVVGRHFSRNAVAALLPHDGADLDARLESLRRSELIERDTGWFLGEPVLRFHHVLIRDAAYRRVLKGTRAELHARFADWVEARAGDAVEHDETIGWHLEQAHQHLRELGPLDAHARALGERAARHLAAAGRRALARDDLPLAAGLLGRALHRFDVEDPARADLALDWCEALLAAGDVGPAAAAIAELGRFTAGSDRLRAWHTCFTGQLTALISPQALHATADAVAAAAEELAALGDTAGEAKAHFVQAQAFARLGKVGACEAALDRALAAARRAGDRRRANTVLAVAPLAALWGPSPVTRASGRCLDVVRVLRITQGAPAVEAVALSCQGVLEALRGRTEAARRMIASARKMVEELGITHRLLEADVFAGRIDLLEGDADGAERSLRGAYEGLRDLGLGIDAAQAAALLARALLAQGRSAEAETLSHESESLAGDDLKAAIAWRGVRAEALARRGEHAGAIELAQAAVAIAAATDALLDHADARLALAAALRAAGRSSEADAEERRATELWEAKGATLLAEHARHDGGRVAPIAHVAKDAAESARSVPVRANAATANIERLDAAMAARDIDAAADLVAVDATALHHPTATSFGYEGLVTLLGQLVGTRDLEFRHEPLATLGDALGLFRETTSFSALDDDALGPFGAVERERIVLIEVDESGRERCIEFFATDRLNEAIGRSYERYAELLPDGVARARAVATARTVAAMLRTSVDVDRLAAMFVPDIEMVDHRTMGTWGAHGTKAALDHVRALNAVADEIVLREHGVLGLHAEALLVQRMHSRADRLGGGSYERLLLMLLAFATDGRLARIEWFDCDREAEALACFDGLVGSTDAEEAALLPPLFVNTATRTWEEVSRCWRARDWQRHESLMSPGFRMSDRRKAVHLELDRDQNLEFVRSTGEMSSARLDSEVLATRGNRAALARVRVEVAEGDVGPSEMQFLNVIKTDDRGNTVAMVRFDPEDFEAAYAELDACYEAGEGAACERVSAVNLAMLRAFAGRDAAAAARLCAPDLHVEDHRPLSFGTLRGTVELVTVLRLLFDLAPDVRLRVDHFKTCDRGALIAAMWLGTRDGGAFEIPWIAVSDLDDEGRIQRLDFYNADQLDDVQARFGALATAAAASAPAPHFANAATRVVERTIAAFERRDWEGFGALFAPGCRFLDRRPMIQLQTDREEWLASYREIVEMTTARPTRAVLATRGDRLALVRVLWTGAQGDIGPSELEWLLVIEVDGHGDHTAVVTFDANDREPAYAELDARWEAGEAAAYGVVPHAFRARLDAINRRDWDALLASCAPDFAVTDHRLLGWGTTLRDAVEFVRSQQALAELSPDARYRVDHLRTSARAHVCQVAQVGTREGGAFETPLVFVGAWDESGRALLRVDVYDVDQLDLALQRFEEIGAHAVPPPARLANAATRLNESIARAWIARDWDAVTALHAPTCYLDDRRTLMRMRLQPETSLEQLRILFDVPGSRWGITSLATRGERLALSRVLYEGEVDAGGGALAIEYLAVDEVDDTGRSLAVINFDPEDLDAAYAELDARYDAGEGAASSRPAAARAKPAAAWDFDRRWAAAFNARDWEAVRALMSPDLRWEDRRPLFRLAGDGELFLSSVRERAEVGALAEFRLLGTAGEHVAIERLMWSGGPSDGRFEIEMLGIIEIDEAGRMSAVIVFDPDDVHAAQREAFERWSAIDAEAPAALDSLQESMEAFNERDRVRFRACFTDDFVLEDRRRTGMGRIVGADAYADSIDVLWKLAPTHRVEIGFAWHAYARHGGVIVLRRSGALAEGGDFESEYLMVFTTADGRCSRLEFFELDALEAALERFEALRPDPLRIPPNAATRVRDRWREAVAARDWAAVRSLVSDDFVYEDRGKRALVCGDVETWIASMQFNSSQPGFEYELELMGTLGDRIMLERMVWTGGPDGDMFEIEHVWLFEVDAVGRVRAVLLFDPDDRGAAFLEGLERFAAGEGAANGGPAFYVPLFGAFIRHDWSAFLDALTPDFSFADHRTLGLGTLDRDEWVGSLRALAELTRGLSTELSTLLALDRHGLVAVSRVYGSVPDGGPFENVLVSVFEGDGQRLKRYEAFDVADVDHALARFEQLRPTRRPGDRESGAGGGRV